MLQHLRRPASFVISLVLLLHVAPAPDGGGGAGAARAQVRATYDRGAAGLGQSLRRLQTTASALHTGAHPDDEDTALIARLARGDSARVGYLSLNRGEGGQNIIGPELFEPLGVIRTEELLQSRRLDGGEQLFTRAFDYGFSKSRAEAAEKWGEGLVLGDMVRAIRLFRPLVVVSRFTGTAADGHGQHQLAGHLTPQAVRAAADPAAFPEHAAEGLRPWRTLKFYVSEGFAPNASNEPTLLLDTGDHDPLIGRSYFEVAMEGRSQHKSQEMGLLELRGAQTSGVRLIESAVKTAGAERGLFDGIDTSIRGIARLAGIGDDLIGDELNDAQRAAARALSEFDALAPRKSIAPLAEGLRAARKARAKLAAAARPAERPGADADFMLARKEREFEEALRRAAGVEVDALSASETIAPGESASVSVRAFVPQGSPVKIGDVRLRAPADWASEAAPEPLPPPSASRRAGEPAAKASFFTLSVPQGAEPTRPYWLREPRDGYVFRWPAGVPKSEPFAAPPVAAEVSAEIGGEPVVITAPVQYRYADDIRGELRRELNVVPALDISLDSNLIIAPTASLPHAARVAVRVANNSQGPVGGDVRLRLPEGWAARPPAAPFKLSKKGERAAVVFNVTVPRGVEPGEYKLSAQATSGGTTYELDMREIAYPHIQTHRIYAPAEARVRVLDLRVAPVRVGYVMGSGDAVPAAIERMGLQVTMLGEDELSAGDLSRFDTIVVGVRASQVRPDFVANHNRLLDFVRAGGALVVQYQRPDYAGLAPFPAKIGPRVTDEAAPVTILQPAHQAFNFPNRIGADDWAGWVQERSLYNFTAFDPRYVPLLESHDAGEEAQRGGEVYAEIGRGKYVYTSYAWFRQLPSGVPGAYRLFANLVSLPAKPPAPAPNARRRRRQP